ncbi:sigma-E processing peptidase SpoIIGA [Paraliobacillus sp. X-1268]|uniref:sigma-E processing peptidase SpoIIGA n=1 Tax=Paraliobacillus sp. X-1268 TaxID=2213193 RepID=UPI000E3C7EB2|nr:sigma-E processing peptidase SpoIIGA [Paraliobacillus sp. X-1268]
MTIYVDAVFLLNFLIDWMILLLTQQMSKMATGKFSLLIAAVIAALLVPITIFYPNSIILHPIGKLVYSVLIVFAGFGFHNMRRFTKLLVTFYFISIALGGGLTGLHFFIKSPMYYSEHGFLTWSSGYGDPISWLFVVIGFPIVWIFTKKTMDKHALLKFRQDQYMQVTIVLKEKEVSTIGYVDSGNHLVDPISQKPVIICDYKIINQLFQEEEVAQLKEAQETCDFDCIPDHLMTQVQFVPYQGVSGDQRFLVVVKPKFITIEYGNQLIKVSKVLIGIQFGKLTADESYHCLLQPGLFNEIATNSA